MPVHRKRLTAAYAAVILGTTVLAPLAGDIAPAAAAPINLARTGTATASSVELDRAEFAAPRVNDGDRSTRWSSKYQDDSWVQVKLAAAARVDHVTLSWPNACARDFVLQTSADGTTWTDVARLQRDTCPRTDAIDVKSAQPVTHVRMQGRQRWGGYGYSIAEFGIWDSVAASPSPSLGLIPKPVSLVEHGGTPYTLTPASPIVATGVGANAPAAYLAGILRPSTGYALPVVAQSSAAAPVVVEVGPGKGPAGQAAEGYRLAVTSSPGSRSARTSPAARSTACRRCASCSRSGWSRTPWPPRPGRCRP